MLKHYEESDALRFWMPIFIFHICILHLW